MIKPTIQAIKEKNQVFFSRDTMRFFHQTMKDFKVVKSPKNRIFVYAKMKDGDNRPMGYTFRECPMNEFGSDIAGQLKTVYNTDGSMFNHNSLTDIINFIQEN